MLEKERFEWHLQPYSQLHCIILHCSLLHHSELHHIELHQSELHCTALIEMFNSLAELNISQFHQLHLLEMESTLELYLLHDILTLSLQTVNNFVF